MTLRTTFALCVLVLSTWSGCGYSLGGAREDAAQRSCAFYSRCEGFGSGKTYPNQTDCLTQQRANWTNTWPTDKCDGKINTANMDICLKALDATVCNNGLDFLATLSKCGSSQVCQ